MKKEYKLTICTIMTVIIIALTWFVLFTLLR